MKYIKIFFIALLLLQITNVEALAVVTNKKPTVQKTISEAEKHQYFKNYLVYLRNLIIKTCGYDEELLNSYRIVYYINLKNNGKINNVQGDKHQSSKNLPVDLTRGALRIERLQYLKPYNKHYNISQRNPVDVVYGDFARFTIALSPPEYRLNFIYNSLSKNFVSSGLRSLENVEYLSAKARVKLKFNKIGYGFLNNLETQWKPINVILLSSSGDIDFDELMIAFLKKQIFNFDIVSDNFIDLDITLYGNSSHSADGNIMIVK